MSRTWHALQHWFHAASSRHAARCCLFLAVASVLACVSAPSWASQAEDSVAPNPNLHVEGIPAIPKSLAERVSNYTDFRGHSFVAWHPSKPEMLVVHRAAGASTTQLFWLRSPMGELVPLTRHPDPVGSATVDPLQAKFVVFSSSRAGSEAFQLFRVPVEGGEAIQLTDEGFRHTRGPWRQVNGRYTGEFLLTSVPLDRRLRPEERDRIGTTLRLMNPERPREARVIAELPGVGWVGGTFDPSGETLLLTRWVSANESEIWRIEVASARRERILPKPGEGPGTYMAGPFTRDGRGFFFLSDRDGEFRELMHYRFGDGRIVSLSKHLPHDVEGVSDEEDHAGSDLRRLYSRVNVRGRSEIRAFDPVSFNEVTIEQRPQAAVLGIAPRRGASEVALTVAGATTPSEIWVLDERTGKLTRWTKAASPIDTSAFPEQEIVTWTSFDGREISGLLSRPPARFTGRRPVIINIHGGPEAQATIGFRGRWNYFVNELGIAVIEPNVRGSSGFGKTFLALDNGVKREDAVRDIGALLDWIGTRGDLDPSRVLVTGGSYGGYMSLATAVHYSDRIAGAVSVVGISHFVTFLESTESYRRDLRRAEYGDERDPKMREFLHSISPLTHAHRIRVPLLVAHGRNDPRVAYTEAEQIVAKVRANGVPVWYLRAENEGHGFARRENADFYFFAFVRFVQETLKP
ncbi:MAG: prolyl oligopeptidase family serine peptidase [Casimicrobiaceae bacterium]|nr:prolyl oligopeptidase family serine peptidase [Casimicrobiaceae bacterium]